MNRFAAPDPQLTQSIAPNRARSDWHARAVELEALVADLRRSLVALQASEERYRTAFRFSPNAITITRLADGRYLDVNDGFTRAYGWLRDDVIGRTTAEVGIWKNPADRQALVDLLRRSSHTSRSEPSLRAHWERSSAPSVAWFRA